MAPALFQNFTTIIGIEIEIEIEIEIGIGIGIETQPVLDSIAMAMAM